MTSTARCSTRLAFAGFASLALAVAAHAAAPAESTAAAADAPSSGLPVAIGVLFLGGTMLVALLVIIATRSMRSSVGRLTRSDRAAKSSHGGSTDAWREAGRRHPVPPRESEGATDDDGPSERFG